MKTILLVTGVRGGSGFFQQLLDGHSQILTLPGHLRIDSQFKELFSIKSYEKIAEKFIKMYPEYFNSKLNKFERHDRLGKNKNKFFKVNKKKFSEVFFILMKNEYNISNFKILKNIHLAYAAAKGEDLKKKKILFLHPHLVTWTKELVKFIKFDDATIIHIIRHPLAGLNSAIKNWLKYKKGNSFFPKDLYFEIDLAFNGIYDLMKLKKVFIIKYENLHWKNKIVMKNFCRIFRIKYEKCLSEPTLFGLKWWGDKVSRNWLSGVNKNYKIKLDNNFFYYRDLFFFQFLTNKIIKKYQYDFLYEKKNFLFNVLPLKCEILVWSNSFKYWRRWKQIVSIPYFYFKRILLINRFAIKSCALPKLI